MFAKEKYIPWDFRTTSDIQVIVVCKHGLKQKRNVKTGTRDITHVYYTNCPFRMSFGFSKKIGAWRLSSANWLHTGHELDKETYRHYDQNCRLTTDEISEIKKLTEVMHLPRGILAEISRRTTGITQSLIMLT